MKHLRKEVRQYLESNGFTVSCIDTLSKRYKFKLPRRPDGVWENDLLARLVEQFPEYSFTIKTATFGQFPALSIYVGEKA